MVGALFNNALFKQKVVEIIYRRKLKSRIDSNIFCFVSC